MSRQKQKEPLSLRIAKITLAIIIFTGIGTIIFGGGVVIMKYYNGEVNNRTIRPVDQETDLNIATNDQDLIFEKILCEPEKDYVFNYGIEGDKSKLPCRDCPNGYIFQATHTSFHLTSELGISHKTEIKSCVKIKYRTINELNEKDVKIGNYNTEGYIVWESTCKGLSRAERSVCAVKPKEIIISKNNETIEDETELTNNQLRVINPGDGQIEIGSKYRFLLRLEEIGSDDNKFKYFKGIRFEKIEDDKPNTSDWQTYRNEEFGFEMKYPDSWLNASNAGYGEVCITAPYRYIYSDAHENGCVRINILQNPRHFDAKTFYEFYCQEKNLEIRKKEIGEGQYCFSDPKYKHIQIGNVDAINFYSYLAMSEEITIWIPYNNIIVQLNLLGYCTYEEKNNREKEKILMEIVNTFKFTEK